MSENEQERFENELLDAADAQLAAAGPAPAQAEAEPQAAEPQAADPEPETGGEQAYDPFEGLDERQAEHFGKLSDDARAAMRDYRSQEGNLAAQQRENQKMLGEIEKLREQETKAQAEAGVEVPYADLPAFKKFAEEYGEEQARDIWGLFRSYTDARDRVARAIPAAGGNGSATAMSADQVRQIVREGDVLDRGMAELEEAWPDYREINKSPEFQDYLARRSTEYRDFVQKAKDPRAVIEVFDEYLAHEEVRLGLPGDGGPGHETDASPPGAASLPRGGRVVPVAGDEALTNEEFGEALLDRHDADLRRFRA